MDFTPASTPVTHEPVLWSNQEATKKSILELATGEQKRIGVIGLTGTGKTAVLESIANEPGLTGWTVMSVAEFASTAPIRMPEKMIIVYGDYSRHLNMPTVLHRSLNFESLSAIPEIKDLLEEKPNFVDTVKDLSAIGLGSESIVKVICRDLSNEYGERAEDLLKVRVFSFIQNFSKSFNGLNTEVVAGTLLKFVPLESKITQQEIETKLQELLPIKNFLDLPSIPEAFLFKAFNACDARTFEIPGSVTKYLDMARKHPDEPRLRIMIPLPSGQVGGKLLEHFVTDLSDRMSAFNGNKIKPFGEGWDAFGDTALPRKACVLSCDFADASCQEVMSWSVNPENIRPVFRHLLDFSVTKPERAIYLVAGDHDWMCTPDALAFVALAEMTCQKMRLPYYFYANAEGKSADRSFHSSYYCDGTAFKDLDWTKVKEVY